MTIQVAIADDHAVFRSGLCALLEKEPDVRVVAEAGTAEETLAMVDKSEFDVLILDISMPGATGTSLAGELLKKNPDLAIVILTMHEEESYLQQLLAMGVRGYVLKKSTGPDLIQAIHIATTGKRYIDPDLVDLVISPFVGKEPKKDQKKETGGLSVLTPREQEIFRLLAHGYSHAKVAEGLYISPRTVETHRANIMAKLNLKNRADLVHFAINNGLMTVS